MSAASMLPIHVATGFEAQKRTMPDAYADTVLLAEIGADAFEALSAPPAASCKHGCGYEGTGDALSTHERAEHSRCHQCGQDPHGSAPVAHLTVCQRYTQTGERL